MAKQIQVKETTASNWITLPGGTGEISFEAGQITDTIFGQDFESTEGGIISWSINAQAFYKGFAGYQATFKKAGTAVTASADESMTLVSGKTYRIGDQAKSWWEGTPTFQSGATGSEADVDAANVASIDRLFGTVTFVSSFTPGASVLVKSGFKYRPVANSGKPQDFTLQMGSSPIDTSDMGTTKGNSGYRTYKQGLRTVSIDVNNIYADSNPFYSELVGRSKVRIEISPDGRGSDGTGTIQAMARGLFKAVNDGLSGDVGALEQESVSYVLNVEDDANETPFSWFFQSASTIPAAVKLCLEAFLDGREISVRYLPDGKTTDGWHGNAIVSEMSLSTGLEAMNEFSPVFMGTGAPTSI